MPKIDDYLSKIMSGAAGYAKDGLKDLIKQAKDDKVEFIKSIGRDLERYVKELASGEISKQEFEDLVKDLASLEKIECRKLSAKAKIRAEEIAQGITEMVVDNLFKLIKD